MSKDRSTEDRWQEIDAAFDEALELEGAAREAMLERLEDSQIRQAVERLLALEPESREALSKADALQLMGPGTIDPAAEGSLLGPYRVLSLLGQGGMGQVYLAERADDEFRQRVAIKVSRPLISDELRQRFKIERQILADLDHPNIARLLDGGTTDAGLSYLVMDYIEGTAIDTFCESQALSPTARIQLVETVCAAVQYAHRMLVVHRDLKPSNILITEDGTPKLLDFGIAKLLSSEDIAGHGGELTREGRAPLTPNYASPEQWRGAPLTTATDVYSMGVLLYQLLTGRLPRVFDSTAPAKVEAALRDREPTAPQLDPDLDRVLLRALATEPAQRYGTVEAFAEDLERYRLGLPVRARRQTVAYRAGKLLRRHRVAAAALLTGLLALTGFSIDRAQQARRLAVERDISRAEAKKAEELSSFLTTLLREANPWQAGLALSGSGADTPEPSVRQVLDRGVRDINRRFTDQDAVRAALLDTMGTSYLGLGRFDEATELLEQALDIRRQVLDEDDPDLAESLVNLGDAYVQRSEYDRAQAPLEEAIALLRRSGAAPLRLASALELSSARLAFQGDLEAAEGPAREAVDLKLAHGASALEIASGEHQLGTVLLETGAFEEAARRLEAALEASIPELGEEHPRTTQLQMRLAGALRRLGDFESTERLLRDAAESRRKVFGADNVQVAQVKNDLAAVLAMRGSYEEAEELYRGVLTVYEENLGKDHRDIAIVHFNIGHLLHGKEEFDGARVHLERSLEIVRSGLPPGHPGAAHPMAKLAQLEMASGNPRTAEPLLRQALALRLGGLPPTHALVTETRHRLGACLLATDQTEEAEQVLLEAFAQIEGAGKGRQHASYAGELLAQIYRERGQEERVAEIEARLEEFPRPVDTSDSEG